MQRLVLALLLLGITPAAAADLALKRVMLSSAGVGYFEYETEVDGPATLGLDVPLDQVDDVLTSLVVFDSTGAVGTVELPGRDNTRANFGNVPFGPEALRSTVDYLNSLQGVEISVQGPRPMTGRIVHAERVAEALPAPAGQPQPTVQRTRVTVLGADGLRQFVLEEADSIQVTDPDLRARIGQALEFAAPRGEPEPAPHHPAQHRRRPSHGARRLCRRGAAVEGVVPAGAAGEGRRSRAPAGLGGAGEPVGRQLGRRRADPAVRQSGHVSPGDLSELLRAAPRGAGGDPRPHSAECGHARAPGGTGDAESRSPPAGAARMLAAPAPPPAPMPQQEVMAQAADQVQAAEGVEATIFQLATPVVLAAGHTASVPIIDRSIPAERVDLAAANDTHPLSAIRITNDTGASIPAGVLTLYDASGAATFAGDARLGGLPAGERRLLSFAQDLRTTVERSSTGETTLASLTAAQGVLHITTRQREVLRVTITGPANEPRRVLVEIPKGGDRTLTLEGGPIPGVEETATAWRVPVSLKPGEVRKLTATIDRLEREQTALLADDAAVVVRLLNEQTLTPAARTALQRLAALRQDEAAKRATVDQLKAQQAAILQDEDRIRRNLAAVAANDALHARLTRALDADETRLEQLNQAIEQATAAADKAHQVLAEAAGSLRI